MHTGFTYVVPVTVAGALTTGNKATFVLPTNAELVRVTAAVGTAPAGSDLLLGVSKNGSAVFSGAGRATRVVAGSTKVVAGVPNNPNQGVNLTGAVVQDTPALGGVWAIGDVATFSVDQVGSGTAGSDLSVLLQFVVK